jgi:hypothetical protein
MGRLMVAASAAFLLAVGSTGAFAEKLSGTISDVDVEVGSVTLNSGETFYLSEDVDIDALEIGESVTVEFEDGDDGDLIATSIEPAN